MEKLRQVQIELKAPKNQFNSFGKYNYRSLEDILEAVKPLLEKYELTLTLSDKPIQIGAYIAVEATARITDGENEEIVTASAGIDPHKKGMDQAQAYGASSSYARKYALNGLFLIDDTKDADSTNKHDGSSTTPQPKTKPDFRPNTESWEKALQNNATPEQIRTKYTLSTSNEKLYLDELENRK